MVEHVSILTDILVNIAQKVKNSFSDHGKASIHIYFIQIWAYPKRKALLFGRFQVSSAKANIDILIIVLEVTNLSENFRQTLNVILNGRNWGNRWGAETQSKYGALISGGAKSLFGSYKRVLFYRNIFGTLFIMFILTLWMVLDKCL